MRFTLRRVATTPTHRKRTAQVRPPRRESACARAPGFNPRVADASIVHVRLRTPQAARVRSMPTLSACASTHSSASVRGHPWRATWH